MKTLDLPNANEGEIHAPKESLDVEHDYADRFLSHVPSVAEPLLTDDAIVLQRLHHVAFP